MKFKRREIKNPLTLDKIPEEVEYKCEDFRISVTTDGVRLMGTSPPIVTRGDLNELAKTVSMAYIEFLDKFKIKIIL